MYDKNCIFCRIIAGELGCYKIFEDDFVFAFLDIAPFSKGHTLVIPKVHCDRYTELPLAQIAPLWQGVQLVARLLQECLPCDGFNLLQNNGKCANQVVPHLHVHIIPRWDNQRAEWETTRKYTPEELRDIAEQVVRA